MSNLMIIDNELLSFGVSISFKTTCRMSELVRLFSLCPSLANIFLFEKKRHKNVKMDIYFNSFFVKLLSTCVLLGNTMKNSRNPFS